MKKKPKTLDWTPNTPYKLGDIIHVDGAGYSYMVAGRKVKKSDWAEIAASRVHAKLLVTGNPLKSAGMSVTVKALLNAYRRGVREEREACARVFDVGSDFDRNIAAIIRARKAGK